MVNTKDFLGRGWAYPVSVVKSDGRVKMSEYEDDISEAIRIILSTKRGERVMRPEFGSDLHKFMFETAGYGVEEQIKQETLECLRLWEPRITDIEAAVDFPNGSAGGFIIELSYVVRSTNNPYNLVFPFFTTEGRNALS